MRLHTFLSPRAIAVSTISGSTLPIITANNAAGCAPAASAPATATALCVNHFMLRPMIKRKNGTVRFLPRKGQASSHRIRKRPFIRQELPPRGLPTRRKPREEEGCRSGGREANRRGAPPVSRKDSPLPPIPLLHPSTPSTSPGFRASDRSGRRGHQEANRWPRR